MDLTVSGQRVFAATGGVAFDPKLPVVVFIHGAGLDRTFWALQTRWFAHHGRSVLARDLPGHGRSDGPALATVAEMADWVVSVLEVAGVETASLVGHSMGALVAMETAARLGDKCRALALCGVAATMPVHPALLSAAQQNNPVAGELVTDWGHGPDAHFGAAKAPGVWMLGAALRLLDRAPPGVLGTDLAACDAYDTALETAPKVTSPVLIVTAPFDKMTPAKAATALKGSFANARMESIPKSGHMKPVERPDETLKALAQAV